ncbi:winged helix-turn-helix transcriptional regulator [Luteimicrobium sp. DT211]|uniref:winged helix-turn-helix transcriptional regulator n=1 Tax=Luteimicrobium sp. DT211 TaxID=3393412 RepID=UPI003CF5C0FA
MHACPTGAHSTHNVYEAHCPCRALLELIANKWTALAIGALEDGALRFGELRARLTGVSPKVLTQTMRRLEGSGMVTRTVFASVPARVDYELTAVGRSVAAPLRDLREWAEQHLDDVAAGQLV